MPSLNLWMGYARRRRPHASSLFRVAPFCAAMLLKSLMRVVASSSGSAPYGGGIVSAPLDRGDTGLAGTVGFNDFTRMTQHYTSTTGQWGTGDFNFDFAPV